MDSNSRSVFLVNLTKTIVHLQVDIDTYLVLDQDQRKGEDPVQIVDALVRHSQYIK
jgi:hypothetical protein